MRSFTERVGLRMVLTGAATCALLGACASSREPVLEPPDAGFAEGAACEVRCGTQCCAESEECTGGRCLAACDGVPCGDDRAACCGLGELCVGGDCMVPGALCPGGDADCEPGEQCEEGLGRCLPVPEDAACRELPRAGEFDPVEQWRWTEGESATAPLVVQLTDDNDDGTVSGRDVPDVVVVSFDGYEIVADGLAPPTAVFPAAELVALSGEDGALLWQTGVVGRICPFVHPAAGDLDSDGEVEIVVQYATDGNCDMLSEQPARLAAFGRDGGLEWTSTSYVRSTGPHALTIANLDGAGGAEIIAGDGVFGSSGDLLFRHPLLAALGPITLALTHVAVDVDGDGTLEIVTPRGVLEHDGVVRWEDSSLPLGSVAVAEVLPGHPGPQVVLTENNGVRLFIRDADTGEPLLTIEDHGGGGTLAGVSDWTGAPTLADIDGDGDPEILAATYNGLIVFDPADIPTPPHAAWRWGMSGRFGANLAVTAFDFDGDGAMEVLANDPCHMVILRGADGRVLASRTSTTAALGEFPVVVDVDSDGSAEIVSVNSEAMHHRYDQRCYESPLPYTGPSRGVTVWKDLNDNWLGTRSIWNEHGYHIDNIREDGTVPAVESQSWATHNTFRASPVPEGEAASLSPDLVVVTADADLSGCPESFVVRARVQNQGSRGVEPGMPVAFYVDEVGGLPAAVAHTSEHLFSGAATWVEASLSHPAIGSGVDVYVVADDDGSRGVVRECDEGNNASPPLALSCLY